MSDFIWPSGSFEAKTYLSHVRDHVDMLEWIKQAGQLAIDTDQVRHVLLSTFIPLPTVHEYELALPATQDQMDDLVDRAVRELAATWGEDAVEEVGQLLRWERRGEAMVLSWADPVIEEGDLVTWRSGVTQIAGHEHEHGLVVAVTGARAHVLWASGADTWTEVGLLRRLRGDETSQPS